MTFCSNVSKSGLESSRCAALGWPISSVRGISKTFPDAAGGGQVLTCLGGMSKKASDLPPAPPPSPRTSIGLIFNRHVSQCPPGSLVPGGRSRSRPNYSGKQIQDLWSQKDIPSNWKVDKLLRWGRPGNEQHWPWKRVFLSNSCQGCRAVGGYRCQLCSLTGHCIMTFGT